MAKSKSGGTRSYIRGRVGADVYSIGRDAKGAKQQVVRSLAETVANPQTIAQMRGRMIMSTVMQAVSALRPIIDHSFDNVPTGQPNISEFISRNYALIKADVEAHPASNNVFPMVAYQEKGVKGGAYIVSAGEVITTLDTDQYASNEVKLALAADSTVAQLKAAMGLGSDDYFTWVALKYNGDALYCRLRFNPAVADSTVITADNKGTIFVSEGNASVTVGYAGGELSFTFSDGTSNSPSCSGVIVTKKETAGYKHSTCVLKNYDMPEYNSASSDVVLPTYPVGSQMYLNGGKL